MLPSSFERQKIWGIDSAVGQYRTQTVIFSYDYGPYSNDLNQSDETIKYTSRLVEIDGREAKLVLYKILRNERYKGMKFLSGVHFSRVKLEESPGPMTTELTVESLCKVQADCEAMWEVFKTIEFSE